MKATPATEQTFSFKVESITLEQAREIMAYVQNSMTPDESKTIREFCEIVFEALKVQVPSRL